MDAQQATRLIAAAGSDKAFAEALRLPPSRGVQQRVNNWKRRGIPASIQLRYAKELGELAEKAARSERAESPAVAHHQAA